MKSKFSKGYEQDIKTIILFRGDPIGHAKILRDIISKRNEHTRYKTGFRNVDITYYYLTTNKSLKEVGSDYGLTLERVRQIILKMLRILRFYYLRKLK